MVLPTAVLFRTGKWLLMTTVGSDPNVRVTQIEEKQYKEQLTARGIPAEHIRSYGFAFEGKMRVLVGFLVLFSGCQESQSKEKYDVWTNGKKDIVMDKFAFEV